MAQKCERCHEEVHYLIEINGMRCCPKCTEYEAFWGQTRDAQQRNEAEAGEHTCPSCNGYGRFLVGDREERCPECEGTGQV